MSMSNSMAFISQFGEYNPGGGKDEVLKYLEESKKQVILAEKALKKILDTVNSTSGWVLCLGWWSWIDLESVILHWLGARKKRGAIGYWHCV